MALALSTSSSLALLALGAIGFVALRDKGASKSAKARARKAVGHLGKAPEREREPGCHTSGYRPQFEGGRTDHMRNLSPSLRGCDADPIELALEQHGDRLPKVIEAGEPFATAHRYHHPRAPDAWPVHCVVTTVCKKQRLRSFVHRPDESLSVFGDAL